MAWRSRCSWSSSSEPSPRRCVPMSPSVSGHPCCALQVLRVALQRRLSGDLGPRCSATSLWKGGGGSAVSPRSTACRHLPTWETALLVQSFSTQSWRTSALPCLFCLNKLLLIFRYGPPKSSAQALWWSSSSCWFFCSYQKVTLPRGSGRRQEEGGRSCRRLGVSPFELRGTGASLRWPQEPWQGSAESQLSGRSRCLPRFCRWCSDK